MSCVHFGVCGGCSTQDIAYESQLRNKEIQVHDLLQDFHMQQFESIVPSPETTFYRNKMEFSFGDQRDLQLLNLPKTLKRSDPLPPIPDPNLVHVGLHPKKRFSLVTPTSECQLLSKESQVVTAVVERWANRFRIPSYIRRKNKGVLRHLVIREGKNTNERMVNLFSTGQAKEVETLAGDLKSCGVPITTFLWTINDQLSDVARGEKPKNYWGEGLIREKVGKITFRVEPDSFMQTNTHAAERMIEILRSWVIPDQSTLIDLYCGAGTLSLNCSDLFSEVIGIEIEEATIREAQKNAIENDCKQVHFRSGRVEDHLAFIKQETQQKKCTVFVDPPRSGLHPRVVDMLCEATVDQLIYVSCNPKTLSRDLRGLTSKYRIRIVQPMDFFPHTDHVETMVLLERRS